MPNQSKDIRLIYPQWQGGKIGSWFQQMNEEDSAKGYFLGA